MNEPPILFVKPRALSNPDKRRLRRAGIIVIEIDDPTSAKFVRACLEMPHSALLTCAAAAISKSELATKDFGGSVCRVLIECQKSHSDPGSEGDSPNQEMSQ